jgi:hypothetical protein
MKTVILFIIVFSISFNYNKAQGRTQGTDKRTESRTEKEVVKPVDHTPPIKMDNDTRTRPTDPPMRVPVNNNRSPITSPVRPVNPPTFNNTSSGQPVLTDFVPIPIYDEPNDVVVYDYVTQEPPPPPPPEVYYNYKEIGLSQFEDEDFFDALFSFQTALASDTQNYSLYYYIGTTEIELERYYDAINSLTKFIDHLKDNKLGYYQRGLAEFYSGDRDAALQDFLIADQNNVDGVKVILKRYYDYY